MMKIELKIATAKQVSYACMFLHYAKTVPSVQVAFACYEDDVFKGVVCYGGGANNNLGKKYGLVQGQLMELVRVALVAQSQRHYQTSKYVALSMRLLQKKKSLLKLLVSYADTKQGHKGGIYQATNWLYMGKSYAESAIDPETGEIKHTRSLHSKYGSIKGFERVKDKPKHIYVYSFDKTMRQELESKAVSFHDTESGAVPTLTHQEVNHHG
jgi:hypothetical protein